MNNYTEGNCMKLKFKIIDEAKFSGAEHLARHYKAHVLQDGEEFSVFDPKFPQMSLEEYANKAEDLSLADAKEIHSEEELKDARGIVGWKADNVNWRNPRNIKINLDSPQHPGFIEIVAYVDNAAAGNQIMSYMLARRGKKYREFANKISELD